MRRLVPDVVPDEIAHDRMDHEIRGDVGQVAQDPGEQNAELRAISSCRSEAREPLHHRQENVARVIVMHVVGPQFLPGLFEIQVRVIWTDATQVHEMRGFQCHALQDLIETGLGAKSAESSIRDDDVRIGGWHRAPSSAPYDRAGPGEGLFREAEEAAVRWGEAVRLILVGNGRRLRLF